MKIFILGIFGLGAIETTLLLLIICIIVIRKVIKKTKLSTKELNISSDVNNESINKYCKNCGNQITAHATACLSCGCDPKRGTKNCNSCGVETNSDQIICIKCGVPLKNQSLSNEGGQTVATIAYITLIGFIIALVQHSSNKTKLGAYHLRQVLGFMITGVAISIFVTILSLPMLDMRSHRKIADYLMFISTVSFILGFGLFVIIIISFINAINGKEKPAPIFGKLYEKWFVNIFN
jgi:hypothetical protein